MFINVREKIKDLFKTIISKFPITMIGVFLGTLICAVGVDTDIISDEFLQKIMLFLSIATLGNFYIETRKSGLHKDNIYKYIISFFISAFFTMISYNVFEINNEIIIDNNNKLILRTLNISYNMYNNEIKTFTIEGYLLSNEN